MTGGTGAETAAASAMPGSQPAGAAPKWLERRGSDGADRWSFVVFQRDGLGARLGGLINAVALARRTGGSVALCWPTMTAGDAETHAMAPAEDIFDAAFLARHRGDPDRNDLAGVVDLGAVRAAIQTGGPPPAGSGAVRAPWRLLGTELPKLWSVPEYRALCRAAFDAIAFVPALEAARRKAAALPLPPRAVAVHLRAGDVIYGAYRADARMVTKAISYPVAEAIVARERAARRSVVLFGEDQALLVHLARCHGARPIGSLVDLAGMSTLERAIFEITLMTRFERLHAGQSAFAGTAALAGPVQRVDPRNAFEPAETVALIRSRLAAEARAREVAISGRQTAFACRAALHFDRAAQTPQLDAAARLELIELALRHDAFNPHLHVVRAAHGYRHGDADAADEALARAALVAPPKDLGGLLKDAVRGLGDAAGPDLLAALDAAAAAGRPMAAFVLALLDLDRDRAKAAALADVYRAGRRPHLACLDVHLAGHPGAEPADAD